MSNTDKTVAHKRRMQHIREIADGIFDPAERKTILDLVRDYEKLLLPNEGKRSRSNIQFDS